MAVLDMGALEGFVGVQGRWESIGGITDVKLCGFEGLRVSMED